MRLLFKAILSACALCIGGLAQAQPVESFAALPAIENPQLSPNGRWLAFDCQPQGNASVCILDLSAGELAQIVPVPGDAWVSQAYFVSEEYFFFAVSFVEVEQTANGPRDFTYSRALAINPATGESAALMQNQRWSTNTTSVTSVVRGDPDSVIVGMTFFNEPEQQTGRVGSSRPYWSNVLFDVDLRSGDGDRINDMRAFERILDASGEVVARIEYDPEDYEFEIINSGRGGDAIYSAVHETDPPRVVGMVDPGGLLVFFRTLDAGYRRMDLATGELSRLPIEGLDVVSAAMFDWDGHLVGFWGEADGIQRQSFMDEGLAGDASALSNAIGTDVLIEAFSENRDQVVIRTYAPGAPSTYLLYTRSAGSVSVVENAYPGLTDADLPPRMSFTYQASDGLDIEAILTTPPGWQSGDPALPLIVLPHGGPAARDTVAFDWWAQAYAAQGYAVVQPNFRGSEGYGVAFREAGYGEFGNLMIQDILDSAGALQAAGIAQDGQFCVAGASYGGYAALMAGIRAPEDVGCVVAFAPVTNPADRLGGARRFGDFIVYQFWRQYMGDIAFDRDASEAISINARASELTMPVLVLHGENDNVVEIEESEALARSFRDGDRDFEFVRLEGENHFLIKQSSRQVLLDRSLELFDETLR